MNRFKRIRTAIARDLRSSKTASLFEVARQSNPVLEPYPSIAAVLTAMDDDSQKSYVQREALTRALIKEHQAHRGPPWASMLLVAYYPMMSRVRAEAHRNAFDRDDLDQLVITFFLDAIRWFPLSRIPDKTAMRLKNMTRDRVIREITRERRKRRESIALVDVALMSDGFNPFAESVSAESELDLKLMAADLRELVAGRVEEKNIDLVVSTLVYGERLRDYIRRTRCLTTETQLNRTYQRLKKRRTRAL